MLREAISLMPEKAGLHFKLGANLGILAYHGYPEHFDEALLECRLAVQLDPEFGNARNEVGIILGNRRDHAAAEAAFVEAEPYFGDHHHHWYSRGANYVALQRLDDARTAFEKAIALSGGAPDIHCLRFLAATLWAMAEHASTSAAAGKLRREARRAADKAIHFGARDPLADWADTLDIWRDRARSDDSLR